MKILIYFTILFLLFSCKYEKKDDINSMEKNTKIVEENLGSNNKVQSHNRWTQYKRRPVGNINDVEPYQDCFFIIKDGNFFYYKSSKLIYADRFKFDKELNRTLFEKHSLDEIIFKNKDSTEAILKRDNYEGEYEYFKKN